MEQFIISVRKSALVLLLSTKLIFFIEKNLWMWIFCVYCVNSFVIQIQITAKLITLFHLSFLLILVRGTCSSSKPYYCDHLDIHVLWSTKREQCVGFAILLMVDF